MENRAKIKQLTGKKYYGTEITIDTGYDIESIVIKLCGDGVPSDRQLQEWGMALDEAKSEGMMLDSLGHYETRLTYSVAVGIIEKINSMVAV